LATGSLIVLDVDPKRRTAVAHDSDGSERFEDDPASYAPQCLG
jgi:hypothetical protein